MADVLKRRVKGNVRVSAVPVLVVAVDVAVHWLARGKIRLKSGNVRALGNGAVLSCGKIHSGSGDVRGLENADVLVAVHVAVARLLCGKIHSGSGDVRGLEDAAVLMAVDTTVAWLASRDPAVPLAVDGSVASLRLTVAVVRWSGDKVSKRITVGAVWEAPCSCLGDGQWFLAGATAVAILT